MNFFNLWALRETEVALQFSECCAAETALQHWLFCSADATLTKTCAAASERLQRNIEKAALQESGAFLPLSCGFQAPTSWHPRLGPAETLSALTFRISLDIPVYFTFFHPLQCLGALMKLKVS